MDEYGLENSVDNSSGEINESSALDEMLEISDSVENITYEEFEVESLAEFSDVDEYFVEVDDCSIDELEESYSAVTDVGESEELSLAELELERMLTECEESQLEDEEPDEKSLKLVKRWR